MTTKNDPHAILKQCVGKNAQFIYKAIKKNKLPFYDVFLFIDPMVVSDQMPFIEAIFLIPIDEVKDAHERDCYLRLVNNAIVFLSHENKWEEAAKVSDRFIDYVAENIYIAHSAACAYAQTGQKEKAIDMVEKAAKYRYENLDVLKKDRDLESIKKDPRFIAALKKPKFECDGYDLIVNEKINGQEVVFRLCDHDGDLGEREQKLIKWIKTHFKEILNASHKAILEFYSSSYNDYEAGMKSEGSMDEGILPKPDKSLRIEKYLSDLEIYIKHKGRNLGGSFGLAFECTWDKEHGVGVKFKNFKLDKATLQDNHFFKTYE